MGGQAGRQFLPDDVPPRIDLICERLHQTHRPAGSPASGSGARYRYRDKATSRSARRPMATMAGESSTSIGAFPTWSACRTASS